MWAIVYKLILDKFDIYRKYFYALDKVSDSF